MQIGEELLLITSQNCEGCKELRGLLKKNGTLDKYKQVDISTEKGKELVQKLNLKVVPNCVVVRKTSSGDEARICKPEELMLVIKDKKP